MGLGPLSGSQKWRDCASEGGGPLAPHPHSHPTGLARWQQAATLPWSLMLGELESPSTPQQDSVQMVP